MKKAELLAEQTRLDSLANVLARKHWGVDYTGTIELVNRKWRACLGMYVPTRCAIRMSAQTNAEYTYEEIADTLLHELVHWRLHTLGEPFCDENDEFIAECLRVGATLSNAPSAVRAYERYAKRQEAGEAAA